MAKSGYETLVKKIEQQNKIVQAVSLFARIIAETAIEYGNALEELIKRYDEEMQNAITNWYNDYTPRSNGKYKPYQRRGSLKNSYEISTEDGVFIEPKPDVLTPSNPEDDVDMFDMIYLLGFHGGHPLGHGYYWRRGYTKDGQFHWLRGVRGLGHPAAHSEPLMRSIIQIESTAPNLETARAALRKGIKKASNALETGLH